MRTIQLTSLALAPLLLACGAFGVQELSRSALKAKT